MSKFSAPFKVGIVIIIGIVVSIIMIVRFSAKWGQDNGVVELSADFNDATGLALKSHVQIAGIQVGEVTGISLKDNRAHVTFKVREDVALYAGIPLEGEKFNRNGATVQKKLSGILGNYHLELTPGLEGEQLKTGDTIPNVIQAGGVESLLNSSEKIMDNVAQVTETLSTVLGGKEGEEKIADLLKDLNDTMKNVKGITEDNAEKIAAIIDYTEQITKNAAGISETGNRELPRLTEEVSDILSEVNRTMSSVRSGVDGTLNSTQDGIEQLRASIEKLDRTLQHIEAVAANVEQGKGTVGKLLSDDHPKPVHCRNRPGR